MTSLKGKLISLRGPEPADLDNLYLWENDTSLWPFGSTRAPLSRHQIWQYIDSYDGDIFTQKQLRMMIVENESNKAVGSIDIYDFDSRDGHALLGIFIASEFRGKGYASEALKLINEYSRLTLGLHQLAALVSVDNAPSIALFKGCGFKSKGCLKSWIKQGRQYTDVLIFQRLFE
ncbi:MAG: GNAT family N-acetyltransferase [Muribaculaceae bacterium]|nr:GNAT family N-acetyltransferase [Muribaculaceae bacterium]